MSVFVCHFFEQHIERKNDQSSQQTNDAVIGSFGQSAKHTRKRCQIFGLMMQDVDAVNQDTTTHQEHGKRACDG